MAPWTSAAKQNHDNELRGIAWDRKSEVKSSAIRPVAKLGSQWNFQESDILTPEGNALGLANAFAGNSAYTVSCDM